MEYNFAKLYKIKNVLGCVFRRNPGCLPIPPFGRYKKNIKTKKLQAIL